MTPQQKLLVQESFAKVTPIADQAAVLRARSSRSRAMPIGWR